MSSEREPEPRTAALASRARCNLAAGWLFIAWIVIVTGFYLYFMLRTFVRS